jgi:uncharacterized membrane protein YvbJ
MKNCKSCGKSLKQNAKFCENCGSKVNKSISKSVSDNDDYLVYAIFGFLFAIISIFFVPIVFGGLGIWFSRILKSKGKETLSTLLLVISITFMLLGFLYGFIAGVNLFLTFNI